MSFAFTLRPKNAYNVNWMLIRQATLCGCVCLLATCWSGSLYAADEQAGAKVPAGSSRPATAITLDDIRAFKMARPSVPVAMPRGVRAKGPAGAKLPREGAVIAGRVARLVTKGAKDDWKVLQFDKIPGAPDELPRYALPCRLLERMETIAAKRPAVRFRIWGRSTNYKGKSYVLPQSVTVVAPAPASSPTSQPTSRPGGGDNLLQRLLLDKSDRAVVPSAPKGTTTTSVPSRAPSVGAAIAPRRGGIMADRLARVLSADGDKWYRAHFESDNTLRDPPIMLLPCSLLTVARRHAGRTVRISGTITHYKGKRYLLLWKVLADRTMRRF